MENNLKEPIHIEFYGLPGCGKSTLSHIIARNLRELGYTVYEPSFNFDHKLNPLYRKIKKLLYTLFFKMRSGREYRTIKDIVTENGYISFREYMGQLVNIIPKIHIYKKANNGIYLWDEGIVQSSIALAFRSGNNVNYIIEKFPLDRYRTIFLKINLDERIAIERMDRRSTNDSRVEKEKNLEKKYVMMQKYQRCIETINSEITICNTKSINYSEIHKSIIKQIERKIIN